MALANSNPVKELHDELTCAICLGHFQNPVLIQCGHCFCKACITRTWRGIQSKFPCPQCRKTSRAKSLRPNRSLKNVVEISNRLIFPEGGKCKKHQEPLKFYCQVDGVEICVICRESVDHRSHTVIPVEETTKEFKRDLQERLKTLRTQVADIKKIKAEDKETALKLYAEIEQKSKMMNSEFKALRELLADQQKHISHRLENMQKTLVQKYKDHMSGLDAQLLSNQKTITDLENNAAISSSQSKRELIVVLPRSSFPCSMSLKGDQPSSKSLPNVSRPLTWEDTACRSNLFSIKNTIQEPENHCTEVVRTSSNSTVTRDNGISMCVNGSWSDMVNPENDGAFPVISTLPRTQAQKRSCALDALCNCKKTK